MKKKIMSWLLIFAMVIGFAPVNLYANETPQTETVTAESDFIFDASTGTIKKYKGTAEEVVVPKTINGVYVKHIGKAAIAGKKNLTKIVLPEGIETIADQAFMANPKLKTINFPDSLKTIGNSIFMVDKALEGELTLGSNLELLDRFTFGDGSRLGSQNVKLNIAHGNIKLTILRGTFGSEQTNVDIPQGREIRIKVNAFRTEEPVTLDFGTINVEKGITKEDLLKTLQEKVLLSLYVTENDYKNIGSERGKGYELPIDWKLDAIDTNLNGEVRIESLFSYVEDDLRAALELDSEKELEALDNRLTEIKVVGKLNFKGEAEEPSSDEWTQDDFTYEVFPYKNRMEDETVRFGISGFSEKGLEKIKENSDLVIPKEITKDGEIVQIEGITKEAFKDQKINSVVFPKPDKEVGFVIKDSAFENSGLTKVEFEEGLISIETRVFMDNNITEVSIPSTVWKIGSEAFRNNQISKLDISDDVTSIQIDNYSFSKNNLSLVKLPYSIFKIRDFVFRDNPGYENSGVVRLETRNEEHLKSTTYIVTKSDYHEIVLITDVNRNELFKELQKVKGIIRDDYREKALEEFDEVLNKAKEVFNNQKSTQEQIDKALNDLIAAEAKLRESSPDKTKLRDTIKKAEELVEGMFTSETYSPMKEALDEAKEVLANLDANKTDVDNAQEKLQKAMDQLVINKNMLYTDKDFTYNGNAITGFSKTGKEKFKVNKDLVLPDTNPQGEDIEVIGKSAFDLDKDEGVRYGTDTVSSKNGMLSVKLPSKLKRIEENAFRLNNLKKVDFPETLEFIGGTAFNGNKLEKVYLPDSVTEVEGGAFSLNQTKELRLSPNMTKIESGTFGRNIYLTKLVIPEGIKSIGSSAFQGAPLTSLSISSTVEEIEERAFTGHQLEELTIPGNVKKIGKESFAHNIKWKRLKKLTLGEGVEEIDDIAFRFSLLQEVKLPKSIKKLADTAFKDAEDTNKTPVVVKLYTENKEHLKFNNKKSLNNQEVIYKEPSTSTPGTPSRPGTTTPGKVTEQDDKEIKNTDIFKEVFEKINTTRISGKNRQLTAVEVSKRLYRQADTIVLTSSSEMIDSLTSSPLGIAVNGPTLFVEKDTILQEVLAEINRLQPKKVIIAGGDSVVSGKVVKQIEAMGVEVERTAGENRFQTAVKLGEQIRRNSTNKTDIILANGYNFIDALTAGSLAAKMNIPILLTGDSSLNSITEKAIKEWGIKNVIVVGGDQQVSNGIISKLQNDGLKVERIAGKTRVETALKLAERVNPNPEKVIFANGRTYADALIASYLSNEENAPIVLIDKENVPVSVKEYLRENKIKDSIILGGDSSIANVK